MKKEVKKIRFGFWERNFSLLKIGAKGSAFALSQYFNSGKDPKEIFGQITREFSDLKGSLMKAGQLVSIYGEGFLPKEALELLSNLQDQSDYILFRSLKKDIPAKDKEKLKDLSIKDIPFASASIGQVHLGTHKESKKQFAVKIQYPKIEQSIDNDLRALKLIFSLFKVLPKKIKLDELFEEIKIVLKDEINYPRELDYHQFFYKELGSNFIIPRPLKKYSGERILVSSYTPGIHLDEISANDLNQEDRNKLGEDLLTLLLQELFVFKRIQSDPNPANFKIDVEKKKWILYDFGACVEITDHIRDAYQLIVESLMEFNPKKLLKGFIFIDVVQKSDPESYKNILIKYLEVASEVFQSDIFNWGENDLRDRLIPLGQKLMLEFPRSNPPFKTSFIDRKISGTFFLLQKLKSETKNKELFENFFESLRNP